MAFVTVSGMKGQLYVPEDIPGSTRKHNCDDCTSCMICNDDKCAMCRDQKECPECEREETSISSL